MATVKIIKTSIIKTFLIIIAIGFMIYGVFYWPFLGKTVVEIEVLMGTPQKIELYYAINGTPVTVPIVKAYEYASKYTLLSFVIESSNVTSLKFNFGKSDGLLLIRSAILRNGKIIFYDLKSDLFNFEQEGMGPPGWDGNSISWTLSKNGSFLAREIQTDKNYVVMIVFIVILGCVLLICVYQFEKRKVYTMSFIFLLFLIFPLLFFGKTSPIFENRSTNEFPLLQNGNKPKHIGQPIENWFNDHMGFRAEITYHYRRSILYDVNSAFSKWTLPGTNGWYFYTGDGNIQDFTHQNYFSNAELQFIADRLYIVKSELEKVGIKFLLFITPNKHSVYPEFYSPRYSRLSTPSRADKLVVYLKERGLGENIVFVRDYLLQNKQSKPLFLQTDTHWNSFGAFYASQQMLSWVKNYFPPIRIPKIETYHFENSPKLIVGDANLLSGTDPVPEHNLFVESALNPFIVKSQKGIQLEVATDDGQITHDSYYKVRWQVSLDDKLVQTKTENMHNPRAIIYHDSFMMWMYNFVFPAFSSAEFKWKQLKKSDIAEIVESKPDIVVYQVLERFLPNLLKIEE